jgi:hypothetical protein
MTREQATLELHRLCHGLAPDDACVRRLLERIAASDEPEALRAALAELGARELAP